MVERLQLEIRKAKKGDEGLLLDYIGKHARFAEVEDILDITEERVRRTFFEDGIATALIAFEGERAVGFSVYYNNSSSLDSEGGVLIEDLYIDEEYRGRGYGRELLRDAFRRIREEGIREVSWYSSENTQVAKSYELGTYEEDRLTDFFMDLR